MVFMTGKAWVKTHLSILTLLFLLTYLFIIHAEKYHPLRISDNVAFDAKVRFLKDNNQRLLSSDTAIIGSSMGLINLHGATLEETSKKINRIINISSWGEQVLQVEQELHLIEDNKIIKYVIYPIQMEDFSFDRLHDIDFAEVKKYINGEFTLYPYNRVFLNIFSFLKAFYNYKSYHQTDHRYPSLLFDQTGGINYRIYGNNIEQERWMKNQAYGFNMKNFSALKRIAKNLETKNIKFIVVTTPLRLPLLETSPKWRKQFEEFTRLMEKTVAESSFHYLDLHHKLLLGDELFADSSHVNYEGSVLLAEKVASFVDTI
jgi:hypothetical protein